MTATATRPPAADAPTPSPLTSGQLTRFQRLAVVAGAVVVGALTWIPTGAVNWARWAVVSVVVYCAGHVRRVAHRRGPPPRRSTASPPPS